METQTTAEDGYTEAVKTGWRTLREAVCTVIHAEDRDAEGEVVAAQAVIEAVLPMMAHLTGRTRLDILDAVLRRLGRDGRLPVERVRLVLIKA